MEKNSFENNFQQCRIASPVSGRVILASNSPRRRELLAMIVPQFEVEALIGVDESYPAELPAEEVPEYLSRLKSGAYPGELAEGDVLITADTVVIVDGGIMGKPHGRDEAVAMLKRLSGRTHLVVSGVCVRGAKSAESFSSQTEVTFAALEDRQIEEYVDKYSPLDKAGAYGIQEWIGAVAIESIKGSFYNVMGLPVHALYRTLVRGRY